MAPYNRLAKVLCLLMAAALLFSLAACGGQAAAAPASSSASAVVAEAIGTSSEPTDSQATASVTSTVDIHFEGPILVTSAGQSADVGIIATLLKQADIEATSSNLPTDAEITAAKTIIIAPGASSKGLGQAGISIEQEQARTKKMLETAAAANVKIICAHTGGTSRRGEMSDPFIQMVLDQCSYIIVVKGGNDDGLFTDFSASSGIPCEQSDNLKALVPVFQELFV